MFSITLQLGKLFEAALRSEVQFKLFPGSLERWLLVREAHLGQQRQEIWSEWNHPPPKAIPSSNPARATGQCWEHHCAPLEPQAWGVQGVCPDPEQWGWGTGCWFLEHTECLPAGRWYWEHLGNFLFKKGSAPTVGEPGGDQRWLCAWLWFLSTPPQKTKEKLCFKLRAALCCVPKSPFFGMYSVPRRGPCMLPQNI